MSLVEEKDAPQFLYCPRRFGSVVGVCRHLIIKEGPRRIVVQRLPYGRYSVAFSILVPAAYVNRHRIDRVGCEAKWGDRMFAGDKLCPLGKLYATQDAARFALALWVRTALNAAEVDPASLN